MNASEWQQAKSVIFAAVTRSSAEREEYIAQRCADSTLRAEIESEAYVELEKARVSEQSGHKVAAIVSYERVVRWLPADDPARVEAASRLKILKR